MPRSAATADDSADASARSTATGLKRSSRNVADARSKPTTFQRWPSSLRAIAAPMPDLEPVTSARAAEEPVDMVAAFASLALVGQRLRLDLLRVVVVDGVDQLIGVEAAVIGDLHAVHLRLG